MPLTAPPSAPPAAPAAPGDAPARTNPTTFRSLADAFVVWQVGFRTSMAALRTWLADYITWAGTHVTEMNALQSDVSTKSSQVSTNAAQVAANTTTVQGIAAVFGDVNTAVTLANASASSASGSATSASGSASAAQTARSDAEVFASVAATGAKFADTIAAGRALVADGATFGVKAGGSDGLTRATVYRRDSSTTQTLIVDPVPGSEFDDSKDDAAVLARAQAQAVSLGLTDARRIVDFTDKGVFLDVLNGAFRIGKTVKSSPNRFSELAATRAAAGYAQSTTGHYVSFGSNLLRVTNRGALLEAAATNLVAAPSDFTAAPWGSFAGANHTTVTANAGAGPDDTTTADDLVEGSLSAYREYPISLAVGTYTFTTHLERRGRRYAMVTLSGGGLTGVSAYVLDFDTGVFAFASGAANNATPAVEHLYGDVYRVKVTAAITSTANTLFVIRGASGPNYADRNYTLAAATVYVRAWHFQIEAGSSSSSPCTGTRPADTVSLSLSGVGSGDDTIIIEYEGGSATFLRSSLASFNLLNLVTDGGGAWLTKYITRITLVPAAAASYRTQDQRDEDHTSALVAGGLTVMASAVNQLLAGSSRRRVALGTNPANDRIAATDNGSTPYLVANGSVVYWQGQVFGNEAALLSAAGASRAGGTVLLPGYVDPQAPDLLGGVTFTSTKEGFDLTSNATTTINAGKLEFLPASGSLASFSRLVRGYPGRAFKFSVLARKTGAGFMAPAFSEVNSTLAGARLGDDVTISGVEVEHSAICSPVAGWNWWIGGYFGGGGIGNSFWDSPTLKEIAPAQGFPNSNFWVLLDCVMPGSLPVATQVLAQGDIGKEQDRWRVEWRTDGSVWVRRDLGFGAAGATLSEVQIGSAAAGQVVKIAAGMSRTQLVGAVGGSGAETELVGAPGFSAFRIGCSFTGEAFAGTISSYAIYAGLETSAYMKRVTRSTAASAALQIEGDSYMESSSTGLAMMLSDLGYEVMPRAVGGSTMLQQRDRILAATDIADMTLVWWDGSPNGHTPSQYAMELGYIDNVVAALGHNRWLWVRNGQIGGGTELADMTNLYNAISTKYGSVHVYDPVSVVNSFGITDPANGGYTNDQADIAAGKYPRSTQYDAVHLRPDVRRAVALDMQKAIERIRRL